ncbi:MAG: 4Fe-4S binding protein [Symbiobacteriaceae bacterium]|nr:4Fe-4S binding protein [Symbiobacteriaceae bacterium]
MAYKIGKACIACGLCKTECPTEAITEGTPYVIDPEKCVDCGACSSVCPAQAAQPE